MDPQIQDNDPRDRRFIKVDLPLPDFPTIAHVEPLFISKLISSKMYLLLVL